MYQHESVSVFCSHAASRHVCPLVSYPMAVPTSNRVFSTSPVHWAATLSIAAKSPTPDRLPISKPYPPTYSKSKFCADCCGGESYTAAVPPVGTEFELVPWEKRQCREYAEPGRCSSPGATDASTARRGSGRPTKASRGRSHAAPVGLWGEPAATAMKKPAGACTASRQRCCEASTAGKRRLHFLDPEHWARTSISMHSIEPRKKENGRVS